MHRIVSRCRYFMLSLVLFQSFGSVIRVPHVRGSSRGLSRSSSSSRGLNKLLDRYGKHWTPYTSGHPHTNGFLNSCGKGNHMRTFSFLGEDAARAVERNFLKNDQDLVAHAKHFVLNCGGNYNPVMESALADDFVFEGSCIGPLNKKDFVRTMKSLAPYKAFPDLKPNFFGFQVDPSNPLRLWFFLRVRGTHSQPWKPWEHAVDEPLQPTNVEVKLPTETASILFDQQGRVRYYSIGVAGSCFLDNSGGTGAIMGLFAGIRKGIRAQPSVSEAMAKSIDQWLAINEAETLARGSSSEDSLPEWWTAHKEEALDGVVSGLDSPVIEGSKAKAEEEKPEGIRVVFQSQ